MNRLRIKNSTNHGPPHQRLPALMDPLAVLLLVLPGHILHLVDGSVQRSALPIELLLQLPEGGVLVGPAGGVDAGQPQQFKQRLMEAGVAF